MAFNIGKFFGVSDDDPADDDYERQDEEANDYNHVPVNTLNNNRNNVVPLNSGRGNSKSEIVLYEPRVYSDAKEVAENLIKNKAVVINFGRMEDSSARRIVDFITGTVYALKGKIQRIGDKIFLATPSKFETDGKISELIDKKDNLD